MTGIDNSPFLYLSLLKIHNDDSRINDWFTDWFSWQANPFGLFYVKSFRNRIHIYILYVAAS